MMNHTSCFGLHHADENHFKAPTVINAVDIKNIQSPPKGMDEASGGRMLVSTEPRCPTHSEKQPRMPSAVHV